MLKSKALMVLGHSDCRAVRSALDNATPGANIQAIIDAIRPGIAGATDLDDAITRNVRAVIDTIRARAPCCGMPRRPGEVTIVGAVYDIKTATVTLL